ncbi:hypothetical protein Dimus_012416 [Dionaea muscipula]
MRRDSGLRVGKRADGGGFRRRSSLTQGFIRDIESCQLRDVDDVVNHLRSNFPRYARIQLQPLTRSVRNALDQLPRRNPKTPAEAATTTTAAHSPHQRDGVSSEDGGYLEHRSPSRKKLKPDDRREERLRRLEDDYLRRSKRSLIRQSSTYSSESDSEGEVSTSEDAIYSEKLVPEFDLMKSMLRESYGGPSKGLETKGEEKNLEIDDASKEKKVAVMGGDAGKGNRSKRAVAVEESEVKGGAVKGKEGYRFRDLGGMSGVLEELKMEVIVPLYHPQLPRWLGVRPMAGILLHGPPGCGKTKLAHAIANETGVPFYQISATEVVSGVSGASEENIRELFSKAYRTAPSIVFIDEIDAIASKRENLQREMEKRIVTQLMTCMDESHKFVRADKESVNSDSPDCTPGYVLVIGATNRPDAVDPALRRPGRFDREIVLGVPDENARAEILSVLTQKLRLEGEVNLLKIARATPGFVGADLAALANKAGNLAMQRIIDQRRLELSKDCMNEEDAEEWWRRPWLPEEMEKLSITMADFEEAAKMVQPSSRREGFSMIPNVKWEDVGGLTTLREEFERYVVRRIKYPEDYKEFGVDLETGFLLYGPPGCGKTLIAKAVANEAGANFIHIKGPELLTKYVGESELAVRTIFSRARTCSPCILFFDEVDALTTKRGKEGGWVVERLLNQVHYLFASSN